MVTPVSCYVPTSPAKSNLSWQEMYRMCADYYAEYSGQQDRVPWPAVAEHDKFFTTRGEQLSASKRDLASKMREVEENSRRDQHQLCILPVSS